MQLPIFSAIIINGLMQSRVVAKDKHVTSCSLNVYLVYLK
ncbi:protein of unknown function [Legionella fallonii LLAP-10]|uniref:Uncharacterized protein n=1 Tax=Legionella fallonii LLAP-10 TaxID=1212491 RepID=A0A098GBJ0_9GAMM|nr:protein of unknown function [Legionella fallonii LLAP-10]